MPPVLAWDKTCVNALGFNIFAVFDCFKGSVFVNDVPAINKTRLMRVKNS